MAIPATPTAPSVDESIAAATGASSGRRVWGRVWGEVWRVAVAASVGLILLVVVFGFLSDQGLIADSARAGAVLLVDIVLGLTAISLLPLRRLAPVTVGVILALISGFSLVAVGAFGIVLISVATRHKWAEVIPVAAAALASLGVVESLGWSLIGVPSSAIDLVGSVIATAAVMAVLIATGRYVGDRRNLVTSLQEWARRDEEEQILTLAREREQERSRIAREMHDVLAHRLSLVALHAGALQHRVNLDHDETARIAEIVRSNARAALDELREVLGVLRQVDSGGAPELPQPSIAELPALINMAQAEGATVTLDLAPEFDGQLPAVPSPTGRHIYRIVQEALTNARRHAPIQPVAVSITGAVGQQLRIQVSNTLPAGSAARVSIGHGLVGIEERARSLGGHFVLRRDERTHVIDVALPWPAS